MDFSKVVEREKLLDVKRRKISELESKIKTLESVYRSPLDEEEAKERMKNKIIQEFREYFTKASFESISSVQKVPNKFLGELQNISASIGGYKVEMSIAADSSISLAIPHVSNTGKEEYRLLCKISSEDDICTYKKIQYDISDIEKCDEYMTCLRDEIRALQARISTKQPLKVVYVFNEGHHMNTEKEYTSLHEIIASIPEK